MPLPAFVAPAIGEACEGKHHEDLVFPNPSGTYLRHIDMHERKTSCGSAVIDSVVPRVTPHDLRHAAAGFAVSAGANVKAVQRMLGHSSAASILDVYAEVFDDILDGVALALNDPVSRMNVP